MRYAKLAECVGKNLKSSYLTSDTIWLNFGDCYARIHFTVDDNENDVVSRENPGEWNTLGLYRAGVITNEEYWTRLAKEAKKLAEQEATRQREDYERLKKKFEPESDNVYRG